MSEIDRTIYTVVDIYRYAPMKEHFEFQPNQSTITTFLSHEEAVEHVKTEFLKLYNSGQDCMTLSLLQLYEKLEPMEKLLFTNLENAMRFPNFGTGTSDWKHTGIFQVHPDQTVQIHKTKIFLQEEKKQEEKAK